MSTGDFRCSGCGSWQQLCCCGYIFSNVPEQNKAATVCPVCGGKGRVASGWSESQGPTYTTAGTATKTCHGCSGKGWVTV